MSQFCTQTEQEHILHQFKAFIDNGYIPGLQFRIPLILHQRGRWQHKIRKIIRSNKKDLSATKDERCVTWRPYLKPWQQLDYTLTTLSTLPLVSNLCQLVIDYLDIASPRCNVCREVKTRCRVQGSCEQCRTQTHLHAEALCNPCWERRFCVICHQLLCDKDKCSTTMSDTSACYYDVC
jgi:hypothetical protein